MMPVSFEDFYKVPYLKFDISKLRKDLEIILKKRNFNSLGISNFGAIPLNQIPNNKESVRGHNVRGKYWTIAEEVYEVLKNKFKLGRLRLLLKEPRSTLSWHKDPEPRLHIPIITNLGCSMVIENVAKHLPADGSVTITNNTKYHNFFNGGEQARIHLVACVLENPFN